MKFRTPKLSRHLSHFRGDFIIRRCVYAPGARISYPLRRKCAAQKTPYAPANAEIPSFFPSVGRRSHPLEIPLPEGGPLFAIQRKNTPVVMVTKDVDDLLSIYETAPIPDLIYLQQRIDDLRIHLPPHKKRDLPKELRSLL